MHGIQENHGAKQPRFFALTKSFGMTLRRLPGSVLKNTLDVGREDPRRVVHAMKMGMALALVSMLYLWRPLFVEVGTNAMWSVMTVALVLEFTVGATLYKGLNRGVGTFVAGALAILVDLMSRKLNEKGRAIIIGWSVFLVGFVSSYLRFFPYIKKNYDYGVIIFLLTFNLISISSFRVENILQMARARLYTICIGCCICLFMCLLILPNWSGEDLHNSTIRKLEALAKSVEACVDDYFQDEEIRAIENQSRYAIYKGYKSVLDSKSTDESLALYASWEPKHSRHYYPWQQYVKLGTVLRHFAYTAESLHGCLECQIQAAQSLRRQFQIPCVRLAGEVSNVLMELASSIRNHRHCPPDIFSDHLTEALKDLNSAIKSQPRLFHGETLVPKSVTTTPAVTDNAKPDKDPSLVSSHSVRYDKPVLQTLKSSHSVRYDKPVLQTLKSRKLEGQSKVLRPTLSKIAILEFADALPLAAFTSLLVEMVARLELVTAEVEELGRAARFKRYQAGKDTNNQTRLVSEELVLQIEE